MLGQGQWLLPMLLLFERIAWSRDDLSRATGSETRSPHFGGGPDASQLSEPFAFAQ
jgi:hypothetical protein